MGGAELSQLPRIQFTNHFPCCYIRLDLGLGKNVTTARTLNKTRKEGFKNG